MTEVPPVVTHHQITVDGKALKYTATTGRLPIKRGDGKIEAEMFFVAYTLDGQDAEKRPLTFAFNGGPGSATIWLHMGALGPRRAALQPDGLLPPAPYRIADNPHTLLDKSDVVFIDAISTGFSRAANAEMSKKFLGVKGDIEAFSEFIRLYLSRYERWNSPLFLFGESYGTTRAAGIAGHLAGQGISFNGITLLSTALSFQTLEDTKSNDQPYVLLIPTFTMIAGYHKKLPADLMQDMDKARQESTQWAATEYTEALAKGDAITPEERQKVIDHMARYTGLSKEVIDQANLRIDVPKFTHYLLLDQKLRVGRLDGRFTGPDPNGVLDTPFYDPTEAAVLPPFTSVFNHYVRTELGYKTDMPYHVFPADENFFESSWNWGSGIERLPGHSHRAAPGHRQESLLESTSDGRLLRPGDSVLCRRLHHRAPESEPAVPQEYFFRYLQCGTHDVSAHRRPDEIEERRSRFHGQSAGRKLIVGTWLTENGELKTRDWFPKPVSRSKKSAKRIGF